MKSCQKLQKVAKSCQKLQKVAKSCEKLSKVVKSCEKLQNVLKLRKVVKNYEKLWKVVKSCEKLSKVVKSFQKLSNVVDSYQKMPKLSKVVKKYHFLLHVFWFANIYPKSHWLRNVAHSTDFAQSTVSGGGLTVECATQHNICKATPDWLGWPQKHKPQKQEIRFFCIVQTTVSHCLATRTRVVLKDVFKGVFGGQNRTRRTGAYWDGLKQHKNTCAPYVKIWLLLEWLPKIAIIPKNEKNIHYVGTTKNTVE